MVEFLELLSANTAMYFAIRRAKDSPTLIRGMREQMTASLYQSLTTAFPDGQPDPPLDVLTVYIVGAQLGLIDWWMENRTGYTAGQLAVMLHRLQRAAVMDAYRIQP